MRWKELLRKYMPDCSAGRESQKVSLGGRRTSLFRELYWIYIQGEETMKGGIHWAESYGDTSHPAAGTWRASLIKHL